MKPSCMIKPVTPMGVRRSTIEELVEWCNNLAKSVGVFNTDPKQGPIYECTVENFGK